MMSKSDDKHAKANADQIAIAKAWIAKRAQEAAEKAATETAKKAAETAKAGKK
jgi:hypothetical protein